MKEIIEKFGLDAYSGMNIFELVFHSQDFYLEDLEKENYDYRKLLSELSYYSEENASDELGMDIGLHLDLDHVKYLVGFLDFAYSDISLRNKCVSYLKNSYIPPVGEMSSAHEPVCLRVHRLKTYYELKTGKKLVF